MVIFHSFLYVYQTVAFFQLGNVYPETRDMADASAIDYQSKPQKGETSVGCPKLMTSCATHMCFFWHVLDRRQPSNFFLTEADSTMKKAAIKQIWTPWSPWLVGGDWNHGFLWLSHHIGNKVNNWRSPSFFRGVGLFPTNQVRFFFGSHPRVFTIHGETMGITWSQHFHLYPAS